MDLIEDPDYAEKMLSYTTEVAKAMCGYYIETGMDVIAIVCPLVSQISPTHFKKLLLKHYKEIFDYIRGQGVLSSFFVCGNATPNIEPMCLINPDSISVDENVDLVKAKEITDRYNIVIGGNIPLTTVMLYGTQQDNMKYVVDLLGKVSRERLVIASGCDMPYDLPVESSIGAKQAIQQTEYVRDILKSYSVSGKDTHKVVLPDYDTLKKPFIEVFILDSISCAACTYMMGAANNIVNLYALRA